MKAAEITLTEEERATLQGWVRASETERRKHFRARVVLELGQGRRHKNVHRHFIPTQASWLNQVEVWISILVAQALAGASFTSPMQVRERIDAFIAVYNADAHPFEWTKQGVFSKHPRAKYAN